MAKLALAVEFLDDFAKLETKFRTVVHKHAATFEQLEGQQLWDYKGLHLEPHRNSADPRARTIRIDTNHRGIVLDIGNNDLFVLTKIGTHDETDRWMANNVFKVNAATGALELINAEALEVATESVASRNPGQSATLLFGHRRDKDFTQLGVESNLIPALRAFTSEDQLIGILPLVPQAQGEALIELSAERSVEEIYSSLVGSTAVPEIDVDDVAAGFDAPATRGSFHLIDGQDELALIMAQPLAQWRVFLHHSQYEMANKETYNGPVRITGGAGTGKTIVAIHRARALAGQLENRSGKPILFTTYTRNLALDIEQQLRTLGGTELLDVVEVSNIDKIAHRLVQTAEGAQPKIASSKMCDEIWNAVIDELGLEFTSTFLNAEWEQVILAQNIHSRAEYFQASRAGRGVPLDRRPRAKVWKAVELFIQRLAKAGCRTHPQIAAAAADYAESQTVRPYQHVIVDETQDLHETQLRFLRALVAEGPNDLFLVGDSHQRIYDRRSSLSKVGINIRGRSRKLKINYRTTHQILGWSLALLGEAEFDDLDTGIDDHGLAGYHSYRSGPMPETFGGQALKHQLDALVDRIVGWIADGVEPEAIGISARARTSFDQAEAALVDAGVAVVRLPNDDLPRAVGVRLGTMHRMKGLEFERVAIIDADDRTIPASWALPPAGEDQVQYANALLQERCLLYVAATRARDSLWVGWSGKPSRFLDPLLEESDSSSQLGS